MDWQLIETAPKDGTPILGWASDEESGWNCMVVEWVKEHDGADDFVEHDAGFAGRILYPGGECGPPTFYITHWQPLPDPPVNEVT